MAAPDDATSTLDSVVINDPASNTHSPGPMWLRMGRDATESTASVSHAGVSGAPRRPVMRFNMSTQVAFGAAGGDEQLRAELRQAQEQVQFLEHRRGALERELEWHKDELRNKDGLLRQAREDRKRLERQQRQSPTAGAEGAAVELPAWWDNALRDVRATVRDELRHDKL
jgi:hypothetical protein